LVREGREGDNSGADCTNRLDPGFAGPRLANLAWTIVEPIVPSVVYRVMTSIPIIVDPEGQINTNPAKSLEIWRLLGGQRQSQ
jgi:hypothetical protein